MNDISVILDLSSTYPLGVASRPKKIFLNCLDRTTGQNGLSSDGWLMIHESWDHDSHWTIGATNTRLASIVGNTYSESRLIHVCVRTHTMTTVLARFQAHGLSMLLKPVDGVRTIQISDRWDDDETQYKWVQCSTFDRCTSHGVICWPDSGSSSTVQHMEKILISQTRCPTKAVEKWSSTWRFGKTVLGSFVTVTRHTAIHNGHSMSVSTSGALTTQVTV